MPGRSGSRRSAGPSPRRRCSLGRAPWPPGRPRGRPPPPRRCGSPVLPHRVRPPAPAASFRHLPCPRWSPPASAAVPRAPRPAPGGGRRAVGPVPAGGCGGALPGRARPRPVRVRRRPAPTGDRRTVRRRAPASAPARRRPRRRRSGRATSRGRRRRRRDRAGSRGVGEDGLGAERAADAMHQPMDDGRGRRGRVFVPQSLDDVIGGRRPPSSGDQVPEELPRLAPAELPIRRRVADRNLSEHTNRGCPHATDDGSCLGPRRT